MTLVDWILGLGALCAVATLIVILVATLWFFYTLLVDVKRRNDRPEFKKDEKEWK